MANTKTPMTPKDASRIQSHSDRTGTNKGFKTRAQSTAAKNSGAAKTAKTEGKGE